MIPFNLEEIELEFNGTFDRGQSDNVPPDHFIDSLNVKFNPSGVYTREGSVVSYNHGLTINRFFYKKAEGIGNVLLYLDTAGNLYGVRNGLRTLLLSIPEMKDFSITDTFNYIYISPHDRTQGLAGEKVYVWDGSTFRAAAGARPIGTAIVAVDGAAGNVDAGIHKLAITYETTTGFLTPPGPMDTGVFVPTSYTAPGAKKIDISNIPVGPTGTIRKRILATKVGLTEYYFVPNATLTNAVTTATINFFDTDLIDSADYLFNLRETIPAGLFLGFYAGRMFVAGFPLPDYSLAIFSKAGDNESFDQVTGNLIVNRNDRHKLKASLELRDTLYFIKTLAVYATQDNGQEPSFWDYILIDSGVGTEVNGISSLPNITGGSTKDRVLVADQSGLLLFDGVFRRPELTWKIHDIWKRINRNSFNTIQVLENPVAQEIFINIPLDNATIPNCVLYGDYSQGLDAKNIKWTCWKFQNDNPVSISIFDLAGNGKPIFRYGRTITINRLCPGTHNDVGLIIDSYIQTYLMSPPSSQAGDMNLYGGMRLRCLGSGNLIPTLLGLDDSNSTSPPQQPLSITPGRDLLRLFNFKNEKLTIKLRVNALDHYFDISKFYVFGKPYSIARPA